MRGFTAAMKKANRKCQLEKELYQALVAEYAQEAATLEPEQWIELCKKLKKSARHSAQVLLER